jgi:glutathione S-transferase
LARLAFFATFALSFILPLGADMTAIPRLTYFNFRGLGEPIRLLLADLDVAFEDYQMDFDAWAALKPQMPFGQVPMLEIDGRTLVQSQAILRHLARSHGLDGADEASRIACDIAAEAVRDAQNNLFEHFWAEGSDAPEAAADYEADGLATWLGRLGAWLGEAPFFGGERPLFCDYYALAYLDEVAAFFPAALPPKLAALRRRMTERPGLAAYIASGRQPAAYGFDPIRGLRRAHASV